MRVLAWNVAGLSAAKLALHDLDVYMSQFDIILLCETRCVVLPRGLLSGQSVAEVPATSEGHAGEGLLNWGGVTVAVRKDCNLRVRDWGSDDTSLWVQIDLPGGASPLIIGVCYIPPVGSAQLRHRSLPDRFQSLLHHLASAVQGNDVLLAGDFNARVGNPIEDDSGTPRGVTDPQITPVGRRLIELCRASGTVLRTGRVTGDVQAVPTFKARRNSRPTRPDHILVSRGTLPQVCSSFVNISQYGSDHWPIEVTLRLHATLLPKFVCQGAPLQRVTWSFAARSAYVDALGGMANPHIQVALTAASNADVTTACAAVEAAMRAAATAADMPTKSHSGITFDGRLHKPWFDAECHASKHTVWLAVRRRAPHDEIHALQRTYHSFVRSKKRRYQLQELRAILQHQHHDPRKFWKGLRSRMHDLPQGLQAVQAWDAYLNKVGDLRLPDAQPLPYDPYPQHDATPAIPLNAPFTLAEVEIALKKLNNGRSCGLHGLPSELLRYARHVSTPEVPNPPHVLARVLLAVLNCAFQEGRVPHHP